jgi:hypothetical protein
VEPQVPGSIKSLQEIAFSDVMLDKRLEKLIRRSSAIGFIVRYGKSDECKLRKKIIVINSRQKTIHKIFSLAHELGHALSDPKCIRDLGAASYTKRTGSWVSIEYEVRAWGIADKLLKKLDLYTLDYLAYKHKCLRAYYTYNIK